MLELLLFLPYPSLPLCQGSQACYRQAACCSCLTACTFGCPDCQRPQCSVPQVVTIGSCPCVSTTLQVPAVPALNHLTGCGYMWPGTCSVCLGMWQYDEVAGNEAFAEDFQQAMTYYTKQSLVGGDVGLQDAYDWRSAKVHALAVLSPHLP